MKLFTFISTIADGVINVRRSSCMTLGVQQRVSVRPFPGETTLLPLL